MTNINDQPNKNQRVLLHTHYSFLFLTIVQLLLDGSREWSCMTHCLDIWTLNTVNGGSRVHSFPSKVNEYYIIQLHPSLIQCLNLEAESYNKTQLRIFHTSPQYTLSDMEVETIPKQFIKQKSSCHSIKLITALSSLLLILIIFYIQASSFNTSASWTFFWKGVMNPTRHSDDLAATFLPLKDLRFAETAMTGNTWFMSSLNDTYEENEAEYLYFPS